MWKAPQKALEDVIVLCQDIVLLPLTVPCYSCLPSLLSQLSLSSLFNVFDLRSSSLHCLLVLW